MPEPVTRPGIAQQDASLAQVEQLADTANEQSTLTDNAQRERAAASTGKIVWTPGFLLTFALVLVLGLSVESLLSQLWDNGGITGQEVLLGHVALVACGWFALGIAARSRWVRVGSLFGVLWALFMGLDVVANVLGVDPSTPLQAALNVAICMALLGTFLGLSLKNMLLSRWDAWLLLLIPILSALAITLIYFLTPQASLMTVENALATCALLACCLCWWLRPGCWKSNPGPTFLFGLVPAILLALALLNGSMHDFFLLEIANSHPSLFANDTTFFFAQLVLLCLLLGCMRVVQSEKINLVK